MNIKSNGTVGSYVNLEFEYFTPKSKKVQFSYNIANTSNCKYAKNSTALITITPYYISRQMECKLRRYNKTLLKYNEWSEHIEHIDILKTAIQHITLTKDGEAWILNIYSTTGKIMSIEVEQKADARVIKSMLKTWLTTPNTFFAANWQIVKPTMNTPV